VVRQSDDLEPERVHELRESGQPASHAVERAEGRVSAHESRLVDGLLEGSGQPAGQHAKRTCKLNEAVAHT
jgi:hypothetical protein